MKKLLLLLLPFAAFGQVKISDMPAATSLTGTELVPIVQGGVNKKANISLWPGGFTIPSLAEAQAGTDNTKGMTPLRVADVTAKVYNVKAYGAKGDGQRNNVGGITSGTSLLNSATANFVVGDIGKTVEIPGAGVAGAVLVTTITGRNSATQVTVAATASTTVSNKVIWWGTDDTAAIQSAINACFAAGATTVYLPKGVYIIAGALVTNDINGLNPNSQLYIPGASVNTTINSFKGQSIKLLGEAFTPIATSSTLNNDQPSGTILKSTLNRGTGTRPSIIGGIGTNVNNYIDKMNYTTMILEYVNVMASSNGGFTCTNMIGVNALDQAQLIYRNGSVTMDCYLYENTMPDPSINGTNSAAVITGRSDNNGGNFIENVWVQGAWHRGFVFGEHTYPKFTWAMGVHTAYTFLNGNFEILGDIGSNSVVTYLEFPNATLYGEAPGTAFVNLNFAFEASGLGGSPPGWLFPTNTLVDAGQNGRGKITYFSANGIDNGNFVAGGNQYGLHVVPSTRLLTKKFNSAGGANSTGYGTTVAFGDNGTIFEISNSSDAISLNNEVTTFIQSNKNNITDGLLAQRMILNNTGASGLAGDPNEKRNYAEFFANDGATLNGKRTEFIFTNSLKQITQQTGDQQQWFTNGTERFRIASDGQFGLGGANYGTSGAPLISQGNAAAPIWPTGLIWDNSPKQLAITNSTSSDPLLISGSNVDRVSINVQNTNSSGNTSFYFQNDRGSFASYGGLLQGGSADISGNLFGLTRADKTFLIADGANSLGMAIGTLTSQPLYFGTNNTERLRILSSGAWGLSGANYGTSGQVLTSQGSGSAPIWSSAGGTYYAPSTLVANATDADFTATANGVHNILDGVASTNRVITIPTGANGDVMKFYNTEDTRVWSFTGATVYLADRVTVVTELLYNVPCHMERIDGRWIITN